MNLQADYFSYKNKGQRVDVSSNVVLSMDGFTILTSQLSLDTEKNIATASHNVTVYRSQNKLEAKTAIFNLDTQEAWLTDLHFAISPKQNGQKLYIHAATMNDGNATQVGHRGALTTCDLPHPHYALMASKFRHVSGNYIEGSNVLFEGRLMGIVPFYAWMPYYRYDLAKRRIVWNIPVVGRKEAPGWGWFMQNAIDYDSVNGQPSSVFIDLFENKGIGYGVRHRYQAGGHEGYVMGYRLSEADTGRINEKLGIEDQFMWEKSKVTVAYKKTNAESLQSSVRQNTEVRRITLTSTQNNEVYEYAIGDSQDHNVNYYQFDTSIRHQLENRDDYQVNWSNQTNSIAKQYTTSVRAQHLLPLFKVSTLNTSLNYEQNQVLPNGQDKRLGVDLVYQQRISRTLAMEVRVDQQYSLNGDVPFADTNFNRYFYRLPEVKAVYTQSPTWASSNATVIIARYQEIYVSPGSVLSVYPAASQFNTGPNTIGYTQTLSRSFGTDGLWTVGSTYRQYVFLNPNRDWFSGDALYSLDFGISYTKDWNWVSSRTGFNAVFSPKENHSPYVTLSDVAQAKRVLSESLLFRGYLLAPFEWKHDSGYDWEQQRYLDYQTLLTFRPQPYWTIVFSGGKKLSPQATDFEQDYYPLVAKTLWTPQAELQAQFDISLDTNQYVYLGKTRLFNSSWSVMVPFGATDPNYQWVMGLTYVYNTDNQTGNLELGRYQMQTFTLTKKDHCQTFTLGYNKIIEEITFRYTINAFPQDFLELRQSNQGFRFGGSLNSTSEERF
jgi:hypothetical protein